MSKVNTLTYGAHTLLYAIPNIVIERVVTQTNVPEGSMRGVGQTVNAFVTQSFLDELARAAGKDTYRFQRALLDPRISRPPVPISFGGDFTTNERVERLRAVLDEAAAKGAWGTPLGSNRGRGIAAYEFVGSFYAVVIEVTFDGIGWVKIDRVVIVGDAGQLVNPNNANAQLEGSVACGLSSAMYGEITINRGRVMQSNFHDYRILRVDEMPPVEIYWILGGSSWGGVGEPVVGLVMAALTNAICDAGGPRIRSLPLKNHKLVIGEQE